jgi:superfamily I DNA/RNA helicase/RecB family exonuclease
MGAVRAESRPEVSVSHAPVIRLVRSPAPAVVVPVLDESQQRVVDHAGGPLLVLAGPGTGKTTTLVEAVVDRVERGADPDQILVLTFSRKAAAELRGRISARLARVTRGPSAWTFHAFCFALVRRYDDAFASGAAPRLLSGPEQFLRVRRLLDGDAQNNPARWPKEMRSILRTRGFAEELRDLLLRAQERGLSAAGLDELGERLERPEWRAAASFFQDYLDVLSFEQALDYAGLVQRAADLLSDRAIRDAEAARYAAVFVDEYQDTDPAQERLLQLLAGGGRDLVVVGDPDQSIYAFRGAQVHGLLEFSDRFRTSAGAPAPTLSLSVSRRAGSELLDASRALAQRIPAPGLPVSALRGHRAVRPAAGLPAGSVGVRTYSSAAQEAMGIADVLRRAHLIDGVDWSQMAVIVRSARRSIPAMRRALVAADVPVAVAGDEIPLADDPAVTPLLLALRCAMAPETIDEERAEALLRSLGGADVLQVRRIRRELRDLERASGGRRPSGHLLVELVRDAVDPRNLSPRVRRPAERVRALLQQTRAAIERGDAVDEVLWAVWDPSLMRARLERQSRGDGAVAVAANRDLDAVVELFETAGRFVDQLPKAGAGVFLDDLDSQEIPAGTLAERAAPGESVRLLTAHRSKGLEWDVVVVAGVQDAHWPDLRRRGSLLGADLLTENDLGLAAGVSRVHAALVDERRLFYVAATRARRQLVVTAVDSGEATGERPSRFVHELGVAVPEHPQPPPHVLSLRALVGELRRTAVDPHTSAGLRAAAAERLARLAAPGDDGNPLVQVAHPGSWWGLRELSDPGRPLVAHGELVPVSPSAVAQFHNCPLQWFLERKAGVRTLAGERQTFGNLLHAIAKIAADDPERATSEAMVAMLDDVWPQLDFEAPWYAAHQYDAARRALLRLADYAQRNTRTLVGTEVKFQVDIGSARLTGSVDRLDLDDEGAGVVVDYKTSSSKAGAAKTAAHPQLAVYQLAVECEAFPGIERSGGAELVQLRAGEGEAAVVESQPAIAREPELRETALQLLDEVASGVLREDFPARPWSGCTICVAARVCPAQPQGEQVHR